jgi:hypothetical protein
MGSSHANSSAPEVLFSYRIWRTTFDNRISQDQGLGKGSLLRPARLEKRTSAAKAARSNGICCTAEAVPFVRLLALQKSHGSRPA